MSIIIANSIVCEVYSWRHFHVISDTIPTTIILRNFASVINNFGLFIVADEVLIAKRIRDKSNIMNARTFGQFGPRVAPNQLYMLSTAATEVSVAGKVLGTAINHQTNTATTVTIERIKTSIFNSNKKYA